MSSFLITFIIQDWGCIVLGYLGYLTNLSMFAWMTVMCVDMSWTFYKEQLYRGTQTKKLFIYCVIGFGLPSLMTIFACICQVFIIRCLILILIKTSIIFLTIFYLQAFVNENSDFNPEIGVKICFVDTIGQKQLVFFHLPVFLTLLINFVGFIFTLRILLKSNNENRTRSKSVGVSNMKESIGEKCPSFFTNLDLDETLKKDLV